MSGKYGEHGLPRYDRGHSFPLNRTPRPAGAVTVDAWHRVSDLAGEGYRREFRSTAFPVFQGLTVHTGGMQFLPDGERHPLTARTVTVSIRRDLLGASLAESQARQFAQALTDAADYIGQHSADDAIEQPE